MIGDNLTIDEFIEIVYKKLKDEVHTATEQIHGSELMLTGVKTVKGKPVEKDKMYEMEVPVIVKKNHRSKLRMAYLTKGRAGVKEYLKKTLTPSVYEKVIEFI